jgi:DNA-binding response OmpR family regulator
LKALVVDDDRVIADLLAFTLRREGFQVVLAYDGETAVQRWQAERPEVIFLDLNLPGRDGFSICRHIRQTDNQTVIIMLTVRDEDDDVVRGLQIGADDYIKKPFSPRQLVARLQAVLRRTGKAVTPAVRQVGILRLDPGRREVQVRQEQPVPLTQLEARLLDYLMTNAGHVVTNEAIINHVWGAGGGNREMLRQLVRRLRSKIEPDPAAPAFVETIPGMGYGLFTSSTEIKRLRD